MKETSSWENIQDKELDAIARRALQAVYLRLWRLGVEAEARQAAGDDNELNSDAKERDTPEGEGGEQ